MYQITKLKQSLREMANQKQLKNRFNALELYGAEKLVGVIFDDELQHLDRNELSSVGSIKNEKTEHEYRYETFTYEGYLYDIHFELHGVEYVVKGFAISKNNEIVIDCIEIETDKEVAFLYDYTIQESW